MPAKNNPLGGFNPDFHIPNIALLSKAYREYVESMEYMKQCARNAYFYPSRGAALQLRSAQQDCEVFRKAYIAAGGRLAGCEPR